MQLGISSYTYGWAFDLKDHVQMRPVDETDLIRLAVSHGISVLQVGDNLPLHDFSDDRLIAFKERLNEHKIRLEIGARKMTPELLERYIGICGRMNARVLRFVIDEQGFRPGLHEIIRSIRLQLPVLEQNNLILALENHDRFKAKDLKEVMEKIGSKQVGICLDTANSLGAAEGIDAVGELLAPYTVNLHIKDFGIRRMPHGQGFIMDGRIAGQGMLDIPGLIAQLMPYHRCETCILEQWVPPEADPDLTLEKERSWADQAIRYLKTIPGLAGNS
ncbi:sugar phosphate isomerase/epimerase family protein [Flavitalea flava]